LEPRKVQKTGYNSLSLTLLKQWTQTQQITHGDTLFCHEEEDGSMRLIPGSLAAELEEKDDTAFIIEADQYLDPGLIEQLVISNYITGRNHIIIRAPHKISNRQLNEIRSAVNQLMGMGIMEETSRQVTLQVALDREQFTVRSLLKRLYSLIASMLNDAMDSLQNLDREAAQNVVYRESEADKLYWLITRLIHTTQSLPSSTEAPRINATMELMGNRSVAQDIESIGDHVEAIASEVSRMKELGHAPPPDQIYNKIREVYSETEFILKEAMTALLSRDLMLANNALSRQLKAQMSDSELRIQLRELANHSKNAHPLQIVATHLRSIIRFASSIATSAIDRSLESQS